MSALAKLPVRMSVLEFLDCEAGDGMHYELVDGWPRDMAPARTIHAFLKNELGSLIRIHLRARGSDCDALANPGVIPHLLPAHNVRIPDLGVTCSPLAPGQATITDSLLLVEILSPSNQAKTWSNVWAYTSIPSVVEILVLHSARMRAELLRRRPEGGWPEEPDQITVGDLALDSIGFRVSMVDLYGRTGVRAG